MEATSKKARRLPEVIIPPVRKPQLQVHQQQLTQQQHQHFPPMQHQMLHFQQHPATKRSPQPQLHSFYHQQQNHSQQAQQIPRILHHIPQQQQQQQQHHHHPQQQQQQLHTSRRLQHPHVKKTEELIIDLSSDREVAPAATPTHTSSNAWASMLPASLTLPLHAVATGGFPTLTNPPSAANMNNSGPVRRAGAKRVANPDDWRLASAAHPANVNANANSLGGGGNCLSFISSPPSAPAGSSSNGFMVSPGNFAGPINVAVAASGSFNNVHSHSHRSIAAAAAGVSPTSSQCPARPSNNSEHFNPARVAAIEKRRSKLKQVSASYQEKLQSCCQKLLLLQQEWREECEEPTTATQTTTAATEQEPSVVIV